MTKQAPPLRTSVYERSPLARTPFVNRTRKPMPGWLRRLIALLVCALLLLVLLLSCHETEKPPSLANSVLQGPRRLAGPVCLEEAVDVSGSMNQYTPQRERAEGELFKFAHRELKSDGDNLSVAVFARGAALALRPTALAKLSSAPAVPTVDPAGTLLGPAIEELTQARPTGSERCAARALVMITDGEINDAMTPDDSRRLSTALTRANYTRMYAVVPGGTTGTYRGQLNGGLLDAVNVYGFREGGVSGRFASVVGDAKPLDVIYGEILSNLTGQRLAKAAGN